MTQPIARSYTQDPPDTRLDAIVIGSGIGRMSVAAILAKRTGKAATIAPPLCPRSTSPDRTFPRSASWVRFSGAR
jgi:hypothetical protein